MIREVNLHDLVILELQAKFPVEHIENRSVIIRRSVVESGKLIASAFVNVTTETAIIFSEEANRFEKARAIKELFKDILMDLQARGFIDNHMFVEDEEFAEMLKKHLGFQDATGVPLVKQLYG